MMELTGARSEPPVDRQVRCALFLHCHTVESHNGLQPVTSWLYFRVLVEEPGWRAEIVKETEPLSFRECFLHLDLVVDLFDVFGKMRQPNGQHCLYFSPLPLRAS